MEILTRSRGGNAYHSDEEWVTDEEATREGAEKVKKLVCVDKWWRGRHVSIIILIISANLLKYFLSS